jgi:hypothetical protein
MDKHKGKVLQLLVIFGGFLFFNKTKIINYEKRTVVETRRPAENVFKNVGNNK